jgi:hypothetical protein
MIFDIMPKKKTKKRLVSSRALNLRRMALKINHVLLAIYVCIGLC